MNPADVLILLWNCPDCVQVKLNMNYDKAFVDGPTGKEGQTLNLFYSFSNDGFKNIISRFDIPESSAAPVLKKSDGEVVNDVQRIIEYMKTNY